MKPYLLLLVVFSLFIGCGQRGNTKKIENVTDQKSETTASGKIDIPHSFKDNSDILIDSVYIAIPSEGTIVKKFRKNNNKILYVSSSFATMKSIYYEILTTKKDSISILKETKKYDKPLTMEGAELVNEEREYLVFINEELKLYVSSDSAEKNMDLHQNRFKKAMKIINKVNTKKN